MVSSFSLKSHNHRFLKCVPEVNPDPLQYLVIVLLFQLYSEIFSNKSTRIMFFIKILFNGKVVYNMDE